MCRITVLPLKGHMSAYYLVLIRPEASVEHWKPHLHGPSIQVYLHDSCMVARVFLCSKDFFLGVQRVVWCCIQDSSPRGPATGLLLAGSHSHVADHVVGSSFHSLVLFMTVCNIMYKAMTFSLCRVVFCRHWTVDQHGALEVWMKLQFLSCCSHML